MLFGAAPEVIFVFSCAGAVEHKNRLSFDCRVRPSRTVKEITLELNTFLFCFSHGRAAWGGSGG